MKFLRKIIKDNKYNKRISTELTKYFIMELLSFEELIARK